MATDQGEGSSAPPTTEVERVFAEWEECFQRHKQELQALRSPQQEYEAKVNAIDARISQWWAAYDEMSSDQKQQERDSLGLLFVEKSSLADQHRQTLEAQQAMYERRQREVFQRLHAAMEGLVNSKSPNNSKDAGNQIEDTVRESNSEDEAEAEAEGDTVETIGDSESVSGDDNSEEERHASIPKGNAEKDMKRPRPDAELSPTRKRLRQGEPSDAPDSPQKTIQFQEVYDNSQAGDKETIEQFPFGRGLWYIVRCTEHNLKFGGSKPLLDAWIHLRMDHDKLSPSYANIIKHMGIQVMDCGEKEAKMNNAVPKGGHEPQEELMRETEEQNEEGRKRRSNRSSRLSTRGRFRVHTTESLGTKMRGQRGRPRGRPRGRGRGRGRSEIMSGRTRSGGHGGEPRDDTVQETLGPGWRQVGSVFRHGPEPSHRRAPRAERDASEEGNTYVRRAPGEVCLAYFGDNAVKTPILILPLNDMESIGIKENLATLNLDEDMPKCCLFSSRSQKYQWARGYEDDGRLESGREYPVLCLTSSQLKKCPASWVAGSDMISIHDDEVGWKLNHHYHEACDVLRKIKPRQPESPARNTDNIQSDQGSTQFLGVDDSMNTGFHEKPNPNPERSTQPETLSDPNGGPASEETTTENLDHQNDNTERESMARVAESDMASKVAPSSLSTEPGQTQPESGGVEESYLENLAHTSLNYARNKADMMARVNSKEHADEQQGEDRPSASYTPPVGEAQAPRVMETCQPRPTLNLQSGIQNSGISTNSETSYNVTGPNAQEGSPRTPAQIGEMFNEIERHMAEKQIRVHWASGLAHGNATPRPTHSSTSAQSYETSSTDTYPHPPQPINPLVPSSQYTYRSPAQETNFSSTLPPLNLSTRTQLWLPPLTSSGGGHETLSPHNTVASATAHQGTTIPHFPLEMSLQGIQPGQYQPLPEDWSQFDPGPLRDDLDHWVRQYNRSPGIGSLMKEKDGFFCPFCPPNIQMTFPQPWDIVDHLRKVHPTGFWVRTAQTN